MRIYLDHAATTPLAAEARAAMTAALAVAGNPSSIHGDGRAARAVVDDARAAVARLAGGAADEIVLTSGGTEADTLGVVGLGRLGRRRGAPARAITLAIEHPAVTGAAAALAAEGFEVAHARVDRDGRVDLDDLAARAAGGGAVIAIAAVNHELGTVQDVAAIAAIARAAGWLVHVDAVAAAGKLPLPPITAVADAVALSAHKLGGPAGAGALWLRRGVDVAPLWPGGHQERGRRGGTENVVGAAGLGAAADAAAAALAAGAPAAAAARAARFEAALAAMGLEIRARAAPRVGTTINARAPGALGESIVIALDLAGVSASTGAACTSGSVAPSPVLLGVGEAPRQAREAVRFSLGATTTDAELDQVLALLPEILARAGARPA